ncbi:hypothetical protein NIES37_20050 [Tolypothrix tenuis PCC 7101]|uniref:Uncharacterized protein n=1 Tax=Tolypothrix tenuis PCC 7101 TaxID=231146 RepID=A0A1Z4MX33_9CYAN|nr:hypothetical protein [Aulosira sp. FACHB-113]BAY98057.1 hypothetical protein NIES37_20050 [Tolypothrix tenuis PCC 7101]BAZ78024.1 hypothetical protein NIES50_66570 [Aulosira laxa NIES-50]
MLIIFLPYRFYNSKFIDNSQSLQRTVLIKLIYGGKLRSQYGVNKLPILNEGNAETLFIFNF